MYTFSLKPESYLPCKVFIIRALIKLFILEEQFKEIFVNSSRLS